MTSTYTIADVFRPDLGSAADGLAVAGFKVSTWSGTNSPPQLGDALPGSPDVSATTSTDFGNYGAWELALPTNEDDFVAVTYASTNYWRRYNCPAFTDEVTSELDVATLTAFASGAGLVNADQVQVDNVALNPNDTIDGDVQTIGTANAASAKGIQAGAFVDHVHAGLGAPIGLAGATEHTRFVGATASGAPTSGSFDVGDFVVDRTGAVWIYTTGDTWVGLLPPASSTLASPGDIKAIAGYTVPPDWNACDGSAISRTTYPQTFAALCPTASGEAVTGAVTAGSNVMVSVVSPVVPLQPGWAITGPGVYLGTTITEVISSDSIQLSLPSTETTSGDYQVAPWGLGDGTTTFNLPDLRSRVPLGQASFASSFAVTGDTTLNSPDITGLSSVAGLGYGMAVSGSGIPTGSTITGIGQSSISISAAATATASGVALAIASNVTARNLGIDGALVGVETVTLGTKQMPSHDHPDSGHGHDVVDAGHQHVGDWNSIAAAGTGQVAPQTAYTSNTYLSTRFASSNISLDQGYANSASAGSGYAHNNMQPFVGMTYIIKVDNPT